MRMTEFDRHARDLQLQHYANRAGRRRLARIKRRALRYAARVDARKLAGAEGPGPTFHRLLGLS